MPQCRICYEEDGILLTPCNCKGSIAYIHKECLLAEIQFSSESKCTICKETYKIHSEPLLYFNIACLFMFGIYMVKNSIAIGASIALMSPFGITAYMFYLKNQRNNLISLSIVIGYAFLAFVIENYLPYDETMSLLKVQTFLLFGLCTFILVERLPPIYLVYVVSTVIVIVNMYIILQAIHEDKLKLSNVYMFGIYTLTLSLLSLTR